MKILKTGAVALLFAFAGQAVAKPAGTPITFGHGNQCSSFEGNVKDRHFTLQAKAHQQVVVKVNTHENVDRFKLKDTSGRFLKDVGDEHWHFHTKTTGKHTLVLIPQKENSAGIFAKFDVCVF